MGHERLEIRRDILKKVSSAEGVRVTPKLSAVYLRLVRAPPHLWERDNVLRLTTVSQGGQTVTAWAQLIALVKVSPKIARKTLSWLNQQELIKYSSTEDGREIIISFEGLFRRTESLEG